MNFDEIRVVAPTGFLGYGFTEEDFVRSVNDVKPHYLAVDAGSTDPGPYYLGVGQSFTHRATVKNELKIIISAALENDIPLVIGSAGGSGGRPHVEWTVDIVRELASECGWQFPMAIIDAEIPRSKVLRWLNEGRIRDFDSPYSLSAENVNASTRIVAQMGIEPIIKAFKAKAQIIICGRACDDAVFAAYPIMLGFDPGLSIHMGKILECGALASEPISMDVMIGRLRSDHFTLEPGAAHRACTVASVSAHSLYERENPIVQAGPGGSVDLSHCQVEQETDRTVKVSGTIYRKSPSYCIKLEGVRKVGYRAISIAGIRCPSMIKDLDIILDKTRRYAEGYIASMGYEQCSIAFHVYGRDGVMKELEPYRDRLNHEIGLVMEVIAPLQEQANEICHTISGKLMHLDFAGQYNNAGNLAFLFSPSEIDVGPVYDFSVFHLVEIDDPCAPFPITMMQIEGNKIKKEAKIQ